MSIHVMSWVLRHSEAKLGARLVLLTLAEFAHDDGSKAFPAVETIAERARLSKSGVKDALRRLRDDGAIIETGSTKQGTKVYTIVMQDGGQNLTRPDSDPGQILAPRGSDSGPNPSTTPSGRDPSGLSSGGQAASGDPVEVVWQRYRRHKPGVAARIDRERREVIRRALKVATVEECCKAIDGCFASPFHQGDNETGKKYDSVSTILRGRTGKETTRERIEFFMGFLDARPRGSRAPAQDVTLGLRDRSHWRLGRKTPRGPDA